MDALSNTQENHCQGAILVDLSRTEFDRVMKQRKTTERVISTTDNIDFGFTVMDSLFMVSSAGGEVERCRLNVHWFMVVSTFLSSML